MIVKIDFWYLTLARMNGIDPMSDKYSSWSSYSYSFNSPVGFNDPSGAEPYNWRDPYGYADDYFKGWDGGFDDGSSSSSGYGETFDDLINKKFGGDPWALASFFWNQSPAGADYHYVPSGDGYATSKISGFNSSDGIISYTVGSYNEFDGNGDAAIRNGTSGEFTAIVIDKGNSTTSALGSISNLGGNSIEGRPPTNFVDEMGQVMNLGGIVWGGSELAIQAVRQNNGPQVIGRFLGFGTQRTAAALRGTLGAVSKAGKILGAAGQLINTTVYIYKVLDSDSKLTTGDHVGFWAGTGVFTAALVIGGPITAGVALGYGALEFGSWLYNGKSLEQNIFDK